MFKNTIKTVLATYLVFFMNSNAIAETDIELSVVCDDWDKNAAIYINGEFTAICSAKLLVEQGDVNLIVVKPVDETHEQVFVKNIVLFEQQSKQIDVVFPDPQLTAHAYYQQQGEQLDNSSSDKEIAQTQSNERADAVDDDRFYNPNSDDSIEIGSDTTKVAYWLQHAKQSQHEKLALEEEKRQYANTLIAQARAGYIKPMRTLVNLYSTGEGVEKNSELANYWQQKFDTEVAKIALVKANNGDIAAMEEMADYYAKGQGVEQNTSEAERWSGKASSAKQAIAVQKKIDEIEFFQMTKGSVDVAGDSASDMVSSGEGGVLMSSIPVPITTSAGIMMDVTSAPTKATELNRLQDEISTRPSTHAKPDAMISKAVNNKVNSEK
ncbi:hypothetical protein RI844_17710 [Thalassotalea fonticola]|uniref:Sel1 repeat family protein n=1 Tax=Thalassotalea fonticola TaxID=3065649 RepID=A0ABZ0GMR3_9GAMM|nr:hypothetical protein RI844_17710 [Colwelliaceae bacterium S1-1]